MAERKPKITNNTHPGIGEESKSDPSFAPEQDSHQSSFIQIFLTIFRENVDMLHGQQDSLWAFLVEKGAFVSIVWIYYALALCGANATDCDHNWIIYLPVQAAFIKGLRVAVFEYAWAYMCLSHLHQAFVFGLPWTFRGASIATSQALPHSTLWRRKWIYLSIFSAFGLGLVLQPLLLLYVSRKLGSFHWFGSSVSECSVYSGVSLHLLRIFCESIEQVARQRGFPHLYLTLCVMIGTAIAILNAEGSVSIEKFDTSMRTSWKDAKNYNALDTRIARVVEVRARSTLRT